LAVEAARGENEGFDRTATSALSAGRARSSRRVSPPWRGTDDEIGGVMTFSEEIIARKDADESARRNELRLRLALDAAAMISFDWDITRDEVRRFEPTDADSPPRLKRYKNFAAVLEAVHSEDREAFLASVRAALTSEDGRYETEIRVVRPDGEIAWYYERGHVERDASGQPARLTGVAQDITERKRAEAALQDSDRKKDEFLATLAHELRNPLAPICNGLAALKRGTKTKEDADRMISVMERQSEHLMRLVDDLLVVSRISHGVIGLVKERVSLAAVIGDALDLSREAIDAAGLELRVSLPGEPVLLDADGVRLTQVFANLLNNATKYTDAGGRIEVEAKRVDDHLFVSVADTGVGIARDMLPRVFDLFSRTGDRYGRLKGGLGIGLALVRNLVELHGGTIEAQSEGEGRGACFVVRLPCPAEIERAAEARAASATQTQASPRVLEMQRSSSSE